MYIIDSVKTSSYTQNISTQNISSHVVSYRSSSLKFEKVTSEPGKLHPP